MIPLLSSGSGGGGGGGGATLQAADTALTLNDTTKAVVFTTAFTSTPSVVANLVSPDGTVIPVSPKSVTTVGFTASWGTPVDAGWFLSWHAVLPTQ